jgi:hypothetical protein
LALVEVAHPAQLILGLLLEVLMAAIQSFQLLLLTGAVAAAVRKIKMDLLVVLEVAAVLLVYLLALEALETRHQPAHLKETREVMV